MQKIVLLVASLSLLGGCATMTKEAFIHEGAGGHMFESPAREVLNEAKKILVEKGYSVREAPDQAAIVTEWKEEMGNSTIAAAYSRYMVEAYPIDAKRCRIRVTRNSSSAGSGAAVGNLGPTADRSGAVAGSTAVTQTSRSQAAAQDYANAPGGTRTSNAQLTRDLNFEWLLMQRVSPEDAKELQTLADERFK